MRVVKDETGEYPAFAWPGGYPMYYLMRDGGILCPKCVNEESLVHHCKNRPEARCQQEDPQWCLVDGDVYWEGSPMFCDNCNEEIESAYGDPDNPDPDEAS